MRIAVLALLAAAQAADLTGTWVAERRMGGGPPSETVFRLKREGTRLTGTMETPMGAIKIENGRV